jgi:hypothetical protein
VLFTRIELTSMNSCSVLVDPAVADKSTNLHALSKNHQFDGELILI